MNSFIVLGDLLNLEQLESPELVPGYIMKRADISQKQMIRRELIRYGYEQKLFRFENRHHREEGSTQNSWIPMINPDDWNYYIIEMDGVTQSSKAFLQSLALMKSELHRLFEMVNDEHFEGAKGPGVLMHPSELFSFMQDNFVDFSVITLTSREVSQLRKIYDLINGLPNDAYHEISRAVEDFRKLRTLDEGKSVFKIMGSFAILEGLLTHNPQRGITTITHQLKKKLVLLNRRFANPIDYRAYFTGPDSLTFEKVIEKLYEYRSNIAHGVVSDFEDSLQILVNPGRVFEFINDLLKELLPQALTEPQLIADLKWC